MNVTHYIGFDLHKKSVSYCMKAADGTILEEGQLRARRAVLEGWARKRPAPWRGAMEATLFSGWIYDVLKPYAVELQMGHPAMMKAIGAAKKKVRRRRRTTGWTLGRSPIWCAAICSAPAM